MNKIGYVIIIILLCIIGYFIITNNRNNNVEYITTTDTIYVERIIHDTVPKLVYQSIHKYITDTLMTTDSIYIPVHIPISNYHYSNTLYQGSDTIKYNAFVSGYKTTLDSIDISLRYPQIIQNTSITRPNKGIKINHGIQVGLGLGIINQKPDIYAGYGLQITF